VKTTLALATVIGCLTNIVLANAQGLTLANGGLHTSHGGIVTIAITLTRKIRFQLKRPANV
jgi:hypothetical protein